MLCLAFNSKFQSLVERKNQYEIGVDEIPFQFLISSSIQRLSLLW